MRRSDMLRNLVAALLVAGLVALMVWVVNVDGERIVPAAPWAGFEPR